MIGGKGIAVKRKNEILSEIKLIKKGLKMDIAFVSILDLEANRNVFLCSDPDEEILLTEVLNVKFKDRIAIRPGFIMRKEIIPLLRSKFMSI